MAGSRQRVAVGLIAAVLAVVTAVVLVNRFVMQAEWWQVDRKVTSSPARWAADIGPPPGPFTTSWQLTTPVRHSGLSPYDQVAHALVQGQLVVVSGRGVDVRDPFTGGERWHYYRAGWVLLGWAATGKHLVVYLERSGDRGDRLLLGFDAVSGRLLWRAKGEVPAVTERSTLRWPAGSGVLLTTDGDRRVLHGRSAATGVRLWARGLPAGCELPESGVYASGGAETLAAVTLICGERSRLFAVDPVTGRVRWEKRLGAGDTPVVTVHADVTTMFDGTALHAYLPSGREFATRSGDDLCRPGCPVAVAAGRLAMAYRSGDTSRLEAIDLASAKTVWSRDVPDYTALTAAGDRFYALRPRLAEDLLPVGVDVVRAADGDTTTVPTPLVAGQGQDGVRSWLAAAGGMLFVAVRESAAEGGDGRGGGGAGDDGAGDGGAGDGGEPDDRDDTAARTTGNARAGGAVAGRAGTADGGGRGGGAAGPDGVEQAHGGGQMALGDSARVSYPQRMKRLIVLRGGPGGAGPVELGGVPAADWPDACALLTRTDLATIRPGGGPAAYVTHPGMARIGDLKLPHPVSCTYEPTNRQRKRAGEEKSATALTVTVEWVASGAPEASAFLAAHRVSQARARELPRIGDEAVELGTSGTIAVRVNRWIIAVNAYQAPDIANRLARAAAAHLREDLVTPSPLHTPAATSAPGASP